MARPTDLRYSPTHEWVRVEGNVAIVGITDYAVEQLNDLVFIELPEVGQELTRETAFGEIESTKTVADLFTPVGGKVVEVNSSVIDDLDPITESPFGKGWLIKIEMSDPGELDALLDAGAYQKKIDAEEH